MKNKACKTIKQPYGKILAPSPSGTPLIYDVLGVQPRFQSYDKYNPAEWPF